MLMVIISFLIMSPIHTVVEFITLLHVVVVLAELNLFLFYVNVKFFLGIWCWSFCWKTINAGSIYKPIAGYLFREGFFIAKKAIIKNDSRILHSRFLGYTTLFVLDPFNNILDGLGYKQKVKPQITLKPVFFNPNTTRASWALNISANF